MKEQLDYHLSKGTMALVPAKHPYYRSIIFDSEGTFLTIQSISELLERFYEGGSYLVYQDCLYVAVSNKGEEVVAFPTKEAHEEGCMWIFPKHIEKIKVFEKVKVFFKNAERLNTNCQPSAYEHMMKAYGQWERQKKNQEKR
ncbi:competence protein ComK [Bacillus testis]|uniref:competence protein ComK n=1 Tax=Bacillus testis TaxID=1622072 RepID=UPI00067E78B2|nr:competence protein ComK [Bacillus testis]